MRASGGGGGGTWQGKRRDDQTREDMNDMTNTCVCLCLGGGCWIKREGKELIRVGNRTHNTSSLWQRRTRRFRRATTAIPCEDILPYRLSCFILVRNQSYRGDEWTQEGSRLSAGHENVNVSEHEDEDETNTMNANSHRSRQPPHTTEADAAQTRNTNKQQRHEANAPARQSINQSICLKVPPLKSNKLIVSYSTVYTYQ